MFKRVRHESASLSFGIWGGCSRRPCSYSYYISLSLFLNIMGYDEIFIRFLFSASPNLSQPLNNLSFPLSKPNASVYHLRQIVSKSLFSNGKIIRHTRR